ncbi:phosphate propanoyltransferase [bacterium]|nr:phosphate propanoyltransferase [bacterium]
MTEDLLQLKVASECSDCRRCWRGNPEGGGEPGRVDRIVQEVIRRVRGEAAPDARRMAPVGVSVRHVHLSQKALEHLYGPGSCVTKLRDLYQPGAYATEQTVTLVGSRMRAVERVRVLAPLRDYVQVELARTDGILLGIDLPVRDSGQLDGATPITLVGPRGALTLPVAIRAIRHVHLSPADARRMGLQGARRVRVRTAGPKALVFDNVIVKVGEEYIPELHLDTDDANAADLVCGDSVEIEI